MRLITTLLLLLGGVLIVPAQVYAAVPYEPTTWGNCVVQGAATIQCFEDLFVAIVQFILMFSGVILFLVLTMGGFKLLTSSGDAKKLEMAKKTITNGILGLVIIVAAYLIMKTIEVMTGVPVTVFTIPSASP